MLVILASRGGRFRPPAAACIGGRAPGDPLVRVRVLGHHLCHATLDHSGRRASTGDDPPARTVSCPMWTLLGTVTNLLGIINAPASSRQESGTATGFWDRCRAARQVGHRRPWPRRSAATRVTSSNPPGRHVWHTGHVGLRFAGDRAQAAVRRVSDRGRSEPQRATRGVSHPQPRRRERRGRPGAERICGQHAYRLRSRVHWPGRLPGVPGHPGHDRQPVRGTPPRGRGTGQGTVRAGGGPARQAGRGGDARRRA
jgi:hypothetical protein